MNEPTPQPVPEAEFNGWWFAIGAVIACFLVLPVDTITPLWKGGIVLFSGGILGAWWKQLLWLVCACVALIVLLIFIKTKI